MRSNQNKTNRLKCRHILKLKDKFKLKNQLNYKKQD